MIGMRELALLAMLSVTVATVHGGNIVYSYDSVNRLISATYNTTGSVATFGFNAAGSVVYEGSIRDTDGDDMPDQWEIAMFGSITVSDGTGDYDGDGMSDAFEYITGTDPDNASSYFSFKSNGGLSTSPGTNVLDWASASNRTYRLEWATNLLATTDVFTTLATGIAATPPTNTYTHIVTNSVNFYRITQEDE